MINLVRRLMRRNKEIKFSDIEYRYPRPGSKCWKVLIPLLANRVIEAGRPDKYHVKSISKIVFELRQMRWDIRTLKVNGDTYYTLHK